MSSIRTIRCSGFSPEASVGFLLIVPLKTCSQVSFRVQPQVSLGFTPEVTLKILPNVSLGIQKFAKEFFQKFTKCWSLSVSFFRIFSLRRILLRIFSRSSIWSTAAKFLWNASTSWPMSFYGSFAKSSSRSAFRCSPKSTSRNSYWSSARSSYWGCSRTLFENSFRSSPEFAPEVIFRRILVQIFMRIPNL